MCDSEMKDISMELVEVRAGKVKSYRTVRSAIDKGRCVGPVSITKLGVEGDQQNWSGHGGIDKALHWYCADHYAHWKKQRPASAHLFEPGGVGENLVVRGLTEREVCIGDQFSLGEQVVVEVSEPRKPCFQLNRRLDWDAAAVEVQKSGRNGWYLRVLRPGQVRAGDRIQLLERPNPQWSIETVSVILYEDIDDETVLKELSDLPQLGLESRNECAQRLRKKQKDQARQLLAGNTPQKRWWKSKLVRKEILTRRVASLCFETEVEQDSPDLALGGIAHVRLRFGPDQKYTRAYSVVRGDFQAFEIAVLREEKSTGGSLFLHDDLEVGDGVEVAQGLDDSGLIAENTSLRHLFIIGGIGITAFVRKIRELRKASAHYAVHYAVRGGPEDTPYLPLLDVSKTTMYYSSQGKRLDVQTAISSDTAQDQQTIIYCCGPTSLSAAVQQRCDEVKWSLTLRHFEDFGGGGCRGAFEVEVYGKSEQKDIYVPEDLSLLQVLRQAGFEVPSSCESGSCGMCQVEYSAGVVIHRGVALTEEEKKSAMLSCVSRGEGKLALEF